MLLQAPDDDDEDDINLDPNVSDFEKPHIFKVSAITKREVSVVLCFLCFKLFSC